MYYVQDVWGKPVIWRDAANWYSNNVYPEHFDRVANNLNDPNQIPPRGAVIVWGANTPGSGGYGHIGIFWSNGPGTNFVSFDSNWGGAYAHLVTHNWSNVVGWLVPKGSPQTNQPAPAPQPAAPKSEGNKLMTPNFITRTYWAVAGRNPSQEEIDFHMEKSNPESFVNGFGDQPLWKLQQDQLTSMQAQINDLNKTITQLSQTIADRDTDNFSKQKLLDESMAKISTITTELESARDTIADLRKQPTTPSLPTQNSEPTTKEPSLIVKIIASLLRKKRD
jgi:hypothetical protein